MPIPTAVKYGREASQPPPASNLEGNNRAIINGSTVFFSQNALRKTRFAIPYGAVIADLGTPTTCQPKKFSGKEFITANGLIDENGNPVVESMRMKNAATIGLNYNEPKT